ncbi:ABC-2 type transporter-domain-containing protein [Fimicolochytrium jonesii]|uniref:ABC-2 type transporter-domain-containing protein n=1 Tax=Fimicolochytrium jonesii TaxID=1396493 RepID=UPI0022FDF53C|nr:ABC-2 type transporter-domain-containing protein [Fimicolochytrium jonesii]KAI8826193.1 ABC-2 type transporter-domain-containing protein [Fimicolochytrium jonesii]
MSANNRSSVNLVVTDNVGAPVWRGSVPTTDSGTHNSGDIVVPSEVEDEADAAARIRQANRATLFGEALTTPLYIRDANGNVISVNELDRDLESDDDDHHDIHDPSTPTAANTAANAAVVDVDYANSDDDDRKSRKGPLNQLTRAVSTATRRSSKKSLLIPRQKGVDPTKDNFDLQTFLATRVQVAGDAGFKVPTVMVTYKNLAVFGNRITRPHIETVGAKIFNIFNPVPLVEGIVRGVTKTQKPKPPARQILMPMSGFIKPGEMTLVLGRPGAGCSTLLRSLANVTEGLSKVEGDVRYNGIDRVTFKKNYSSYIAYSPEDDPHYSPLTVRQTLRFVLECRVGGAIDTTRRQRIETHIEVLLRVFGLRNCGDTKVGDENIRGCSGGEKKRVSIAEQICAAASIGFWDGSTKGLDSSSALDFVRALRTATDISQTANVLSLYQASQDIYDLFDRVLLVSGGHCIYFGPAKDAKAYFESLGFYCPKRKVMPDFLTGITEPNERDVRKGWTGALPNSDEEFEQAYLKSQVYKDMCAERDEIDAQIEQEKRKETFGTQVTENKKALGRFDLLKTQYTTSLSQQFKAALKREVELQKGNVALIGRLVFDTVMAIIVGSAFFQLDPTPSGSFSRGGAIFFGVLYNCFGALASVPLVIQGRAVASKHKSYMLYRTYIAPFVMQVADMPVSLGMCIVWSCINYWMVGLKPTAGAFFTYIIFLFATNQAFGGLVRIISLSAPDIEVANQVNSVFLLLFILYTGYTIPYISMKPWLKWVFWLNPLSYGIKSLLENEFEGFQIDCSSQFMPMYPNAPAANKACVGVKGGQPGQDHVDGFDYLRATYGIASYNKWWNIAILMGFWLVICMGMMFAAKFIDFSPQRYSINAWKKHKSLECRGGDRRTRRAENDPGHQEMSQRKVDVEDGGSPGSVTSGVTTTNNHDAQNHPGMGGITLSKAEDFSWKHIDYTVQVKGGPKQLLADVSGYVRSGQLTALMGSSGAGKTTLIDSVSQRKTMGKLSGQIYVGKNPQGPDFKNITAYCEQMDVHNGWCTVREALQFSARLRQPAEIPMHEKDAYVENIMQILELEPLADALIGEVGGSVGISQEQRKRLTIGVELCSRPRVLLLDEPTSGLDSQAAFNIMRLLRNLADNGQAILCTIHQPSAVLFEKFDALLLLARGGRTVYFGELGPDCETLRHYFEGHGAPPCPPTANVAEYMLDVIGAGTAVREGLKDWPALWKQSPEFTRRQEEIDAIRGVGDSAAQDVSVAQKKAASGTRQFNVPFGTQLSLVWKRMLLSYWRNPSYNFGRIISQILCALLIGFSYYQLENTATDLQNKVFAIFMAMTIGALLINLVQPNYIKNRSWFTRESAAGFYDWKAFSLSIATAEWPFALVAATCFFVIFYYIVGLNSGSDRAGFFWLIFVIFHFFAISLGQMIASVSPTVQFAAILNPIFMSMQMLFCGVTITYLAMPVFWRSWLYWIDPFHYFVEGIIGNELGGVRTICAGGDVATIIPPAGQTCGQYFAPWFANGGPGQLVSEAATDACGFCAIKYGDDFTDQLSWSFDHRWRNLGILVGFWMFNLVVLNFLVRTYKTGR